jgi:hypothetical protein
MLQSLGVFTDTCRVKTNSFCTDAKKNANPLLMALHVRNTAVIIQGRWKSVAGIGLPTGEEVFLFSSISRLCLVPTHSLIQWSQCSFPVVKWPGVMLKAHPHLAPRLRANGAIPVLPPHASAWCRQRHIYIFYL